MTVRDIQGLDRRARVVVFASGSGTNLQALLDACAAPDAPAAVVAAVSDNPTAPALDRARRAGVAAVQECLALRTRASSFAPRR